jgi:hypothetical protein
VDAAERAPVGYSVDRMLRSAFAGLVLRPWFDHTALSLLTRWYFPLSRAWAAALAAGGIPERFFRQVPPGRRTDTFVPRILRQMEARRDALAIAETRWEEAFFGSGPAAADAEAMRVRAAAALMSQRMAFVPLHLEQPFPAVRFEVETPAAVERRHGPRLRRPEAAFVARVPPSSVQASRAFRARFGIEGWLRFPCPVPSVGPVAWARVCTPPVDGKGSRQPVPTLIFAHGIGVEPEYWGANRDPFAGLSRVGMRLIRPEAPWHGRRRQPGFFGGEPILAKGVGGLLDFFHALVLEIGALVAWARATRDGPVAVGGVSLGALTAQLVGTAAAAWPPEMRPDALFLIAPSRSMTAVAFHGSLSRRLGVPRALLHAGWTPELAGDWLPLLGPQGPPIVPPERIVIVLGEADDVTLAEGGEALASDWRVPAENIFRCPAGHFSTSLGLSRDAAPLGRLVAIMRRVG